MKKLILSFVLAMTFMLVMSVSIMATTCPSGTTPIHVETINVDASQSTAVSTSALENGVTYLLEASGTAFAGDTIDFDAQYSKTNRILNDPWTDSVSGYVSYGPGLLDLLVDGTDGLWGTHNPAHTYSLVMLGTGAPVELLIYDIYYPNNAGSLTVDVSKCADVKVHGGGHMLEDLDGALNKRKDWLDISFGGFIGDAGALGLFGEWQINFHKVNDNDFDKSSFHTTEITSLNLYVGNPGGTCTEAMNFGATGEWNGIPGYRIIFRAGDSSEPSSYDTDTVRVTLYNPSNVVVYDTHSAGEFNDESDCVGTARTSLDTGNIIIQG